MRRTYWLVLAALLTPLAWAAGTPDAINYQGVLRDASGAPRDGAFDMRFRFLDAEVAGTEILVDEHLGAGTGAVQVAGGLFSVALGTGAVADGSGPGTYTALSQVFGAFANVWLEIEIDGETLAPRVRLLATPYAHNATALEGRGAASFLDTSSTAQHKSGALRVESMSIDETISIAGGGPAEGRVLTSDASGNATWRDPAIAPDAVALGDLADRLRYADPADLPFAKLRSFDCSRNPAKLTFTVDGTTTGTVLGFVGVDEVSSPFEYLVSLESATAIDAAAQIGRIGRVSITRDSGSTTYSGRITEFGLAGFDTVARTRFYVARIEPRLADLSRGAGYSVNQAQSILQTIDNKLSAAGIAARQFLTTGSYPTLDMTIQYDESDLAFVRRLAEQDGLHFHFRELPNGDEVVFGDANTAFPALAGSYPYEGDLVDPNPERETISTFHTRFRTYSASSRVRGYRVDSATLPEQTSSSTGGSGEIYEYFAEDIDASRASSRAQQIIDRDQVRRYETSGTSNVPDLRAGRRVTISDTTGAGFGGTYVVTRVVHFALADPDPECIGYGNVFAAIPDATRFRPTRRSPKPVVAGPVNGKITGPPGETTFVDSYGRVKVQFLWDRAGITNENSSGWVRVAVPPGRLGERQWNPEVGDEVLIGFQQGDPDRPVVLGSLHNSSRLPPTGDDIDLGGDITVGGNDILFETGARILSNDNVSFQSIGQSDTADAIIYAGDSLDDGAIRIFGGGELQLWPGTRLSIRNVSSLDEKAALDPDGNWQVDGTVTASGGSVRVGNTATVRESSSNRALEGGQGRFTFRALDTTAAMTLDNTNTDPNAGVWTFDAANLDLYLGGSAADEVFILGDLTVSGVKNFAQNHPYRDDLAVVYTALEGDEAGTYTRGSARLDGGVARVALGETFAWVTNPEFGLTAHVTPRGARASLYVASITTSELVVRSDDPADAFAEFDYIVHGLRIGHEEYGVLQERRLDARVPSPAAVEARFASTPERRRYEAAARFRAMDASLGRDTTKVRGGIGAADALRAAIGVHDGVDSSGAPEGVLATAPRTSPSDEGLLAEPRDEAAGTRGAAVAPAADRGDADEHDAARARTLRTEDPELATALSVTEDVAVGDLVVVDRTDPSRLRAASQASDSAIVGIVASRPGVLLGGAQEDDGGTTAAIALSGIVVANVDAGYGAIAVGDLLTSSPTPGHAMRAHDAHPGTIVGKALEPLATGAGTIRVLVMLR